MESDEAARLEKIRRRALRAVAKPASLLFQVTVETCSDETSPSSLSKQSSYNTLKSVSSSSLVDGGFSNENPANKACEDIKYKWKSKDELVIDANCFVNGCFDKNLRSSSNSSFSSCEGCSHKLGLTRCSFTTAYLARKIVEETNIPFRWLNPVCENLIAHNHRRAVITYGDGFETQIEIKSSNENEKHRAKERCKKIRKVVVDEGFVDETTSEGFSMINAHIFLPLGHGNKKNEVKEDKELFIKAKTDFSSICSRFVQWKKEQIDENNGNCKNGYHLLPIIVRLYVNQEQRKKNNVQWMHKRKAGVTSQCASEFDESTKERKIVFYKHSETGTIEKVDMLEYCSTNNKKNNNRNCSQIELEDHIYTNLGLISITATTRCIFSYSNYQEQRGVTKHANTSRKNLDALETVNHPRGLCKRDHKTLGRALRSDPIKKVLTDEFISVSSVEQNVHSKNGGRITTRKNGNSNGSMTLVGSSLTISRSRINVAMYMGHLRPPPSSCCHMHFYHHDRSVDEELGPTRIKRVGPVPPDVFHGLAQRFWELTAMGKIKSRVGKTGIFQHTVGMQWRVALMGNGRGSLSGSGWISRGLTDSLERFLGENVPLEQEDPSYVNMSLSFLRTETYQHGQGHQTASKKKCFRNPQRAHLDYFWRNLSDRPAKDLPWFAVMPLSEEGLKLHVWPYPGVGRKLSVSFGQCVFLRGDVVHGGGFGFDSPLGNPRCHIYLPKFSSDCDVSQGTNWKDPNGIMLCHTHFLPSSAYEHPDVR